MCAISGSFNLPEDQDWALKQRALSLTRGKDFVTVYHWLAGDKGTPTGYATHARLATNDSTDTYPIRLDGYEFAMNGIVGEREYKRLQDVYKGQVGTYTVDSAYLLRHALTNGYSALDTLDYVFAFWLFDANMNHIIIGNKDYPLFYEHDEDAGTLRFSSFKEDGFVPVGNRVLRFNVWNGMLGVIYDYKELVYS